MLHSKASPLIPRANISHVLLQNHSVSLKREAATETLRLTGNVHADKRAVRVT